MGKTTNESDEYFFESNVFCFFFLVWLTQKYSKMTIDQLISMIIELFEN